jgi:hypothetical protein
VLEDSNSITVEIQYSQSITVHIKYTDAGGMIVFDLKRLEKTLNPNVVDMAGKPVEESVAHYGGLKPMPYALEMDGSGCDIFTMHGLVTGDVLYIGRELSQGRVRVQLAGVVEATPENCKAYSEAFGIKVTPHPILGLPVF